MLAKKQSLVSEPASAHRKVFHIMTTCDPQIREVLHRKFLRRPHADAHTRVVNEMGLHHGSVRADVATINGILHGFEIKSDTDTLNRLPLQIEAYDNVFDKSTLVVGETHYYQAASIIPAHWGIVIATKTKKGIVSLSIARKAVRNSNVDPFSVAQLLWKNEVIEIIKGLGATGCALRGNKTKLYDYLVEHLSFSQLRFAVCETLKLRQGWKDHSQPL